MYYGYSIFSGKERTNYIRGGEYSGARFPAEVVDNDSDNFMVMRIHSERKRILEIDDMLAAVNEEYMALSRSVITASDAVKSYVQQRIGELREQLESLELERKQLLAAS